MKTYVLDIETNSSHSHIWCCVTKDIDTKEVICHTTKETLIPLLNKDVKLIGANIISFDLHLLNKLWGMKLTLKNVLMDTLVLSRLLNPVREQGHSLDSWGERLGLGKTPYGKIWQWMNNTVLTKENENDVYDKPIQGLLHHYCRGDVNVTEKLYYHLLDECRHTKTSDKAIQLEYEVQAIIAQQERNGFKLDIPYAMSVLSEIKTKMAAIDDQLQSVFPPIVHQRVSEKTGKPLKEVVEVFNPSSRQQIAQRLGSLGVKLTKTTDKGSIIVDESVLEKIDLHEAKILAEYFMLQKRCGQLESWLEKVEDDGRVHGKVICIGAVTGRATHSSPNMSQVTSARAVYGKELRSCWTVDEGNVLVGVDLSGIELRCFAHYLNDADYINEVVYGDAHTRNQHAFGCSTRDQAKTLIYAMLYGASAGKIGSVVGGTAKRGEEIIKNFTTSLPSYAILKAKVEKMSDKGYLPGLDGRRVLVRSKHAALNTLLQSCGAIIAKQWLLEIKLALRSAGIVYKQVLWSHDEVQIETAKENAEIVGQIVVEAAKIAGEVLQFRCPVGAEAKSGVTWYDCH